ncbi:MAG: type II toxin-antitoxin system HicB family antitoxin, partial [Rhodomicrobium sp.]
TLLVTVPAFPEVATFSKTIDAAPRCAQAAIEEAISARMADREELPHPKAKRENGGYWSEVTLLTYIKSLLYVLCRAEGLTRADLARLLRVRRETVDRLFRLEHESKLSQFERAFQAIGHPLSIGTAHTARAGRAESVIWGRWDRPSA